MKHQRIITNEEKGVIIEEYLTGTSSSREVAKKYNVSQRSVTNWANDYKNEIMGHKKVKSEKNHSSEPLIEKSLELELRRLRKELEDKEFKIKVLETTIKKAGELYGVDLKKKLDTK